MVQMLSPENYIRKKARTLPIYECLVNEEWEESKMAQLSVARKHTNGNITACFYLVDLMCLGVKDTHFMFNASIDEYIEHMQIASEKMDMIDINYVLAHNILFAGLEFAEDYGFKPHKDFTSITRFMLEEDTDDVELIEIDCGINGQPTYMRGPFDDDAKVKRIITQLEHTAGSGNYSVLDEFNDDDDEFDDEDEDDDNDQYEFDDDDDDEFDGMPASEKKELFLNLSSRLESLTDEENKRFGTLTNSIADDLIDIDTHNQIYDEYYEDLDIETVEDEIPDQLLGGKPGDPPISDEIKNHFIEIYQLTTENPKRAAKELDIFEKKAKGLACVDLLELLLLQAKESTKYPKKLEEYSLKHPEYQLIRILWVIEQITNKSDLQEIKENQFKLKTFFPDRETIHSIEKYYFLTMQVFVAAKKNDINRIEALNSVVGNIDIPEIDEEILGAIIALIKVNYLLSYLKH